jgi:hypothetical protein
MPGGMADAPPGPLQLADKDWKLLRNELETLRDVADKLKALSDEALSRG